MGKDQPKRSSDPFNLFHVLRMQFEAAWKELEEEGACDAMYGYQFRRLCLAWIQGSNFKDVREFIRHEANKQPQTGGNDGQEEREG